MSCKGMGTVAENKLVFSKDDEQNKRASSSDTPHHLLNKHLCRSYSPVHPQARRKSL